MKPRTKKALLFPILLFLVLTVFTGCSEDNTRLQKTLEDFSQALQQEPPNGLSLKIYYISPSIFTRAPLTVESLIRMSKEQEIVVDSECLREHAALLKQFRADVLTPVRELSFLDARACYLFETETGGTILEVALGGANNSVFVNGVEVEYNELFYDIIAPFLTEDVRNEVSVYFNGGFFSP